MIDGRESGVQDRNGGRISAPEFEPGWRSQGSPAATPALVQSPVVAFLHDVRCADLPPRVVQQAARCLLDLLGTAAGAIATPVSGIIRRHTVKHMAAGERGARILFDGRRVSPVGAALAGGMTIDSLDCHDGHALTTGHVGAAVLPALLAYVDEGPNVSGHEFLTQIVIGYEIGTRAGIALHRTVSDYHSSGAWNALACAALGARLLRLNGEQTRHALGIAEYHGPRSQAMRCIDHPTMVKDGSGWGAMAGVSAAHLAADGFTGGPAVTVEGEATAELWADLGDRWRILEQYFKPYPVCRWAQPAIEAALMLQRAHGVATDAIHCVKVSTFHEATRLATRQPASTEEAQYSLPYPVAAVLVRGRLGVAEVTAPSFRDPEILRLSSGMELHESEEYNARFPGERWAHVTFLMKNGSEIQSKPAVARGNPENPLTDEELADKFRSLAVPMLGAARSAVIESAVRDLAGGAAESRQLLAEVLAPATD